MHPFKKACSCPISDYPRTHTYTHIRHQIITFYCSLSLDLVQSSELLFIVLQMEMGTIGRSSSTCLYLSFSSAQKHILQRESTAGDVITGFNTGPGVTSMMWEEWQWACFDTGSHHKQISVGLFCGNTHEGYFQSIKLLPSLWKTEFWIIYSLDACSLNFQNLSMKAL